MKGYIALTARTTKCEEIAKHINKDFPNVAKVDKFVVYITDKHMKYCRKYVKENCRTTIMDTVRWV